MPCNPITDDQGRLVAIACSRGGRKKCQWCSGPGAFQCDGPPRKAGRTSCDAYVCGHHKTRVALNKDLCPDCAAARSKEEEMPKCDSCGAEIVWVEMRGTGKRMPLDAKPVSYVVVVDAEGNAVTDPAKGKGAVVQGRVSHFATCPNADKHRKENR